MSFETIALLALFAGEMFVMMRFGTSAGMGHDRSPWAPSPSRVRAGPYSSDKAVFVLPPSRARIVPSGKQKASIILDADDVDFRPRPSRHAPSAP
jgi:hypothetical protein